MKRMALVVSIILLIVTLVEAGYTLYQGSEPKIGNVFIPVVMVTVSLFYYLREKK